MIEFNLTNDAFGRLVLTTTTGHAHIGVVPVHAFPISAPDEGGIALVSAEGIELAWINSIDELPSDQQSLLRDLFAQREFMPEIGRILDVSSFSTPSEWRVETDRGAYALVLKSEDDIRRLPDSRLLIADKNGIHFLIRNFHQMDKTSRRFLDRFL